MMFSREKFYDKKLVKDNLIFNKFTVSKDKKKLKTLFMIKIKT